MGLTNRCQCHEFDATAGLDKFPDTDPKAITVRCKYCGTFGTLTVRWETDGPKESDDGE